MPFTIPQPKVGLCTVRCNPSVMIQVGPSRNVLVRGQIWPGVVADSNATLHSCSTHLPIASLLKECVSDSNVANFFFRRRKRKWPRGLFMDMKQSERLDRRTVFLYGKAMTLCARQYDYRYDQHGKNSPSKLSSRSSRARFIRTPLDNPHTNLLSNRAC